MIPKRSLLWILRLRLQEIGASAEEQKNQHFANEKLLRQRLADCGQKLQEALNLKQANSVANMKDLESQSRAKLEVIDAVQTDAHRLLLELKALQKQDDATEAKIKELTSSYDRWQRTEKQHKKVVARLQSELESISETVNTMQQHRERSVEEAVRHRNMAVCAGLASSVAGASMLFALLPGHEL